jgi:DNA (cytosine-5)-methyltransferase 1
VSRPILLDTFCKQGGAGVGYERAGFRVIGVDIEPQRHYPFEFHQGDALEFIRRWGHQVAAIHGSPPCQAYSIATAGNPTARSKHVRLIAATREAMQSTGRPWVIENVEQAKRELVDPMLLCGRMFGLRADDADGEPLVLDRHRLFESNLPLLAPPHPTHGDEQVAGVYGGGRRAKRLPGESLAEVAPRDRYAARVERGGGYVPRSREVKQALLDIDWMTVAGMEESIPPAYAEHVGRQLMAALAA